MKPIVRASGTTESERYLAALADRAFLRLWSYPSVFVDRRDGKNKNNQQGKELCDLLVVCGDDIVVFSDKSISWPEKGDLKLDWSRWYRRAIEHSVDQLVGAARWLGQFHDRLFLDRACSAPFPFKLPPEETRRVHLVAVAVGASDACRKFFRSGLGTLFIDPSIEGAEQHSGPDAQPFRVGDVNPNGPFVHVFDPEGLDLVLRALDTVLDFTRYLTRRAKFVRPGTLVAADGEEDVLGLYLQNVGLDGAHDFVKADGTAWTTVERVRVKAGHWRWLQSHPGYRAKKAADRPSYVWDRLIDHFIDSVFEGTSINPAGGAIDVSDAEQALRFMAREDRINRRLLGESIEEAIAKAIENKTRRFARRMLPGPTAVNVTTGYIFLMLAQPDEDLAGGYDQYRAVRARMLEAYCFDLCQQRPDLEQVVGIALDAPPEITGRVGGSEDLALLSRPVWTPELLRQLSERREFYDIRSMSELDMTRKQGDEYPSPIPAGTTRQQRRAAERALRKGRVPD